jgi:hypothetical protein
MKKQFFYLVMLFSIYSCQDDVKFNNPSFQSIKDNVFWRAVNTDASLSTSGVLTINAYTRNEILTLKTASTTPATYELGKSASNTANYQIKTNSSTTISFSTGSDFGDGQIVITEYDKINKTISGTFRFNVSNVAKNPLYDDFINFQQGVFYKVPSK